MKKQKGITLIALVLTVIILLILASVVTYSGMGIVNSSKLTAFEVELKTMQTRSKRLISKI